MKLYVVRHAHAGHRSSWSGDDRLRPLSKKGRRQSEALAEVLADKGLTKLMSSTTVRCIETFHPLADKIGVPVDGDERLAEGHDATEALALVEELRAEGHSAVALSSHGDVIPDLLTDLKVAGVTFHDPLTWPKASVWELTHDGTHWSEAHYIYPT